eukprot:gnl/MRDRNA2_/MRDRNA2_96045_c0_seq1.p1 gnl/MRDRNA2_/MRDRNA2_96045_c0~~gnl/MRDRNA2_/MRDRNA2_96045_c0_seq1.p1  ORF type:complete len:339 (+),score=59.33 gnl/MRDRNA2_/MRDRNA2_96045_c0_seq1:146-1162(+)
MHQEVDTLLWTSPYFRESHKNIKWTSTVYHQPAAPQGLIQNASNAQISLSSVVPMPSRIYHDIREVQQWIFQISQMLIVSKMRLFSDVEKLQELSCAAKRNIDELQTTVSRNTMHFHSKMSNIQDQLKSQDTRMEAHAASLNQCLDNLQLEGQQLAQRKNDEKEYETRENDVLIAGSTDKECGTTKLESRMHVKIFGLKGKPELNGLHGVLQEYDQSKDRWVVHANSAKKLLEIRPCNLEVLTDEGMEHKHFRGPSHQGKSPSQEGVSVQEQLMQALGIFHKTTLGPQIDAIQNEMANCRAMINENVQRLDGDIEYSKLYFRSHDQEFQALRMLMYEV